MRGTQARLIRYAAILFAIAASVSAVAVSGQDPTREFFIVIDKPSAEYTVDVGGRMDPGNVEIAIPATSLNPGPTYYWKVRAPNSRGDIGEWRPVSNFRTARGAQ
jgi:hypothetical protein